MNAINLKPNLVLQFEQSLVDSIERLTRRRVDPMTGKTYDLNHDLIQDPQVKARIVQAKEDSKPAVERRYAVWQSFVQHLEDNFNDMQTIDSSIKDKDQIQMAIHECIQ